jgi:hypothetical protein
MYLKGTSSFSLCFDNNKLVLDGYTDTNMAGDVDSRKSKSGYLMKFAGEQSHGNQGCKNVLHYPLQRLNILLLLKGAKSCYE